MNIPVIVSTTRSPIGRAFKGSMVDVRPDDLLAFYLKDLLDKTNGVSIEDVDDIIVGCGLPGGEQGFNIARVSAVLNGWNDVSATTVNRYCASSLQAIAQAASHVVAGFGSIYMVGGVEVASSFLKGSSDTIDGTQNPLFKDAQLRSLGAMGADAPIWSEQPGLPDVYIAMGITAENVADAYGVTRDQMDEFAALSQQRCEAAITRGFFEEEISPFTLTNGDVITADESPRAGTTIEALSGLKSAFRENGRVTAGNACPMNDGASAVMVMSLQEAEKRGLEPLAKVIGAATTGLNPEIMGVGPIGAVRKVLAQTNMTIDDIDLVELNEAFAAQVIPCANELNIPTEKLNINGGAIALGHPFGSTGARIMTTLIHNLQDTDQKFGLETMCVGGGQGMAVIIERF